MADETKKILLEVVLDVNALKKNEADARAAITKLQNKQADLRKSGLETSRAYELLTEEIKLHSKTIKAQGEALAINEKLNKKNTGSIIEQRQELKALKTEYLNLSEEERENSDHGKELQKTIALTTERLKQQEAALGDNRRNVGNYKEELKQLQLQLQQMEPGTEKFNAAAKKAGELKDKINDAKDATKAFSSESKTTQAKNLFGQIGRDLADMDFKGAAEKAKTFASVVKSISFAEIVTQVKSFGSAMIDLGKTLILNPFVLLATAVVGLIYALSKLPASLDVGNKSLEETKEAVDGINKSTEDLRITLRKLQIENDAISGKISKSKSEELAKEEDFKNEFIKLRQERNAKLKEIDDKFNKDKEDDGFKGTKSLLEAAGVELQVETNRREAKLLLNQAYDRKEKLQQEILGSELKNINVQAAVDAAKIASDKATEAQKKRDETNKKIAEDAKKLAADLLEINSRYHREIAIAREEADQLRLKTEAEAGEAAKAQAAINQQIAIDNAMATQIRIAQIQRDNAAFIRDLQQSDFEKRMQEIDIQEAQALDRERLTEEQKTIIHEEFSQKRRQIQAAEVQANLSIAQDGVNSLKVIAGENLEAQKGVALLQVALDEAKAISSLIASSTANPLNSVTFGAAGIAQFAAGVLGLAANIAKVRQIINSQTKGFAEGGRTDVLSGQLIGAADGLKITRSNGDNRLATVKTGEVILNEHQQNLLGGASTFKSIGVPGFAGGGAVLDGGFTARNATNSIDNKILNAIMNLPAPVVIVQDVADALEDTSKVKDRADI